MHAYLLDGFFAVIQAVPVSCWTFCDLSSKLGSFAAAPVGICRREPPIVRLNVKRRYGPNMARVFSKEPNAGQISMIGTDCWNKRISTAAPFRCCGDNRHGNVVFHKVRPCTGPADACPRRWRVEAGLNRLLVDIVSSPPDRPQRAIRLLRARP